MQPKSQKDIRRQTVGDYLKECREKAQITQWDVAEACRYTSAQFVSNWERGVALPPADEVATVARLLGVRAAELFNRLEACEHREVEFKYKHARRGYK